MEEYKGLQIFIDLIFPFSLIIMTEVFIKLKFIKRKDNTENLLLGVALFMFSFFVLFLVYYQSILSSDFPFSSINTLITFFILYFIGRCLIETGY